VILKQGTNVPSFFRRLGYDSVQESDAFANLQRGDLEACRQTLWNLVRGLEPPESETDSRYLAQLLHDILQKLNRRVHRGHENQNDYQEMRVRLIELFARTTHPDQARRVFRRELRRLTERGQDPSSRTALLAESAKTCIDALYEQRTTLSTVAAELNVSPNYLSRVFRQETGRTLTSYIQRVRINHARRLLTEGGESLSEIAYRVGYRNYRDFYRNFVKQENASPRAVRDRVSGAG
jgi:YesN/AraC family two-component response regulator